MKKIFSKEFTIGLCVIVALIILFFGIDYLKGINLFKPANFYTAEYDNVSGLEIAAPITIDGYKVGQVREINFDYDKPGKIKVLLALNKELRLPEGSVARIESTLLSGAFINITLGHGSRMIPIGGNVPSGNAPDLMSSISNDVMPAVNSILPKVDSLVHNLNLIAGNPAIPVAINRLDGISMNMLSATSSLNRSMGRQVPAILDNAGRITRNIDTITDNLGAFSSQLNTLPISESMNNLNELTENLVRFSHQLNDQKSTLGLLMSDPELYNRLNRVSADVDSLIVDIKRNPKRYISIKLL